jgi:SAM-dependent methyltransferase
MSGYGVTKYFKKCKARSEHGPMTERQQVNQQAREFFQDLWIRGDYWNFETSEYEKTRLAHLFKMLDGRRYPRVLEIGCGSGHFTRLLAHIADQIVALDIAPAAIERAGSLEIGPAKVDFRVANIMDYKPGSDGPWDLVVMTETICYLGWLYPFFDVAWLAAEIFTATRAGGWLLLANTLGEVNDMLLLPWIIRTYHDLFRNVGYQIETEDLFKGTKKDVDFEVLMSLFTKVTDGPAASIIL